MLQTWPPVSGQRVTLSRRDGIKSILIINGSLVYLGHCIVSLFIRAHREDRFLMIISDNYEMRVESPYHLSFMVIVYFSWLKKYQSLKIINEIHLFNDFYLINPMKQSCKNNITHNLNTLFVNKKG